MASALISTAFHGPLVVSWLYLIVAPAFVFHLHCEQNMNKMGQPEPHVTLLASNVDRTYDWPEHILFTHEGAMIDLMLCSRGQGLSLGKGNTRCGGSV